MEKCQKTAIMDLDKMSGKTATVCFAKQGGRQIIYELGRKFTDYTGNITRYLCVHGMSGVSYCEGK